VFPSRPPTPAASIEPTEGNGLFQEPEVVTGFAIPADNDVFDLTVTAQQNFGGTRPSKKYNGRNFQDETEYGACSVPVLYMFSHVVS
jgi:hypothetical protein